MFERKEFAMSNQDFQQIKTWVYESCGIVLGEHKKQMVYSRLSRRIRLLELNNFSEYLTVVKRDQRGEFSEFINCITTNLTSFFRESHHFDYVTKTIIPIIKKKRLENRRVRIWSAGCSTGEEPYTIAMVMMEHFPKPQWDFKILATDLDSNVLAKAASGIYKSDQIEQLPPSIQEKWFDKIRDSQEYKVKPLLQEVISFKRLNLLQSAWPMSSEFTIIFCRNVVIYFDQPTKDKLFVRYANLLPQKGYLFLGHSESLSRHITQFESLGKTIYQRV